MTNYDGNLTPHQRLQKNMLALITHKHYRSLGGIIMSGEARVDETGEVPTAATDGFNVIYSKAFISSMPDPELRFVILHENLHKALRHLSTWYTMWQEDPGTANAACDYVINLMIMRSCEDGFLAMPKIGGLLDERFAGMDAGEVYRLLRKEGNGHQSKGFDVHEWGKANARGKQAKAEVDAVIENALRQGSLLKGVLGGEIDRAVGEILAPKVNWQQELWEFVTSLCKGHDMSTWRRPNRRSIDSGVYTPSSFTESMGRLVIAVDTSGSIDGVMISRFLGEVAGICNVINPELLDLIYWDARVAAHEKYGQGQYESLMSSTRPKGGGGTAPSCVSAYLLEHSIKPECIVVLTDGYVGTDWGSGWNAPVLWCVINNKRASATTGRTLHVEV